MTIPYDEVFKEFSYEDQRWIKQRAADLKAEQMTLRELRRLRKLTQARLSKKLKMGQEGISRVERRTDLYLSTLREFVEGVGGRLSLLVEFPDRPPILLVGLGQDNLAAPEPERGPSLPPASTGFVAGMSSSTAEQKKVASLKSSRRTLGKTVQL